MENKFLTLFFFPEFILTLGCLILILLGVFLKKKIFSKISLFSIILLFIVILVTLNESTITFAFYNILFKSSQFILFFKILILFGSIASISISINYFHDLKLERFEIPILILFSTLGMLVLIASII